MPPESSSLLNVHLDVHPTARSKAVSSTALSPGSVVLSVPALSVVLLPEQKGKRCDACLRLESETIHLRNCSRCHSYWYCGEKCQQAQWKAHHKKMCKMYNRYTASTAFQALPSNAKLDSLLLSHLVAELFSNSKEAPLALLIEDQPTPTSTFSSLLSGPIANQQSCPICPMGPNDVLLEGVLDELYSRFGNNNFVIHSHLVSIAHGIFPLASRLFNHSCVPNAAAKYIFTESEPVRMDVVTLRSIKEGEEICLPYIDPALYQTRHQIFNLTYGFACTCPSCVFAETVGPIPQPPQSPTEREMFERSLRNFVFHSLDSQPFDLVLPKKPYETVPENMLPALHESFLGSLSEVFSTTSHDGPYRVALDVGVTILAVYALLYPPNYPQIGMHLLEMAKTAWNAIVTGDDGENAQVAEDRLKDELRVYLIRSQDILGIFGREGDSAGGPLEEIEILRRLLAGNN